MLGVQCEGIELLIRAPETKLFTLHPSPNLAGSYSRHLSGTFKGKGDVRCYQKYISRFMFRISKVNDLQAGIQVQQFVFVDS